MDKIIGAITKDKDDGTWAGLRPRTVAYVADETQAPARPPCPPATVRSIPRIRILHACGEEMMAES